MTAETAFGLLHFLSHFEETVFYSIWHYGFFLLNQRVIDLLSPRMLRCVLLYFHGVTLPTLAQLEEMSRRIPFRDLNNFGDALDEDTLEDGIRLAATAGRVCRNIDLRLEPLLVSRLFEVSYQCRCDGNKRMALFSGTPPHRQ